MQIERVQVEEGFLDGLDVSFAPGLNVIIGERGTGKTSLIELIRFCLGVDGYTADSGRRSLDHALSILGSGQVTVTLSDAESQILVTRTSSDDFPRASTPFHQPIILSQTEIESVGLQAQGRVRLLDGFRLSQANAALSEPQASAEVRSLTAEAGAERREIDELSAQVEEIPELDKLIAELSPEEQKLGEVSAAASEKKGELDATSAVIAATAVRVDVVARFLESVSHWMSSIASVLNAQPTLESWPEDRDPLSASRASVNRAEDYLTKANRELQSAVSEAKSLLEAAKERKLEVEAHARQLRQEVETLQAGAGVIVRQGQQLRERKAQLQSLKQVLTERQKRLSAVLEQRDSALDRLDSIRQQRFDNRKIVARELTEVVGPRIRVTVSRAGQTEAFAAAIADALRGSGLRYNELSSVLSENITPRELLYAVDENDFYRIAKVTGITTARAARTLSHLRECDLGALATITVEDSVALQLLDGADYKDIADLSTGQRCTVVLPLVLRHTDRVLIVDQPEDHIDNAFIADTLIVSVLARRNDGQIIFSTHNANIPVLGNANRVVQLGSDGKRGFPLLASSLDDSNVINAIMTVMEGGVEAFRRRTDFYDHYRWP